MRDQLLSEEIGPVAEVERAEEEVNQAQLPKLHSPIPLKKDEL